MLILDAHVHCGEQDETAPQAYEQIAPLLDAADVQAAVCMPPVGEIYDRSHIDAYGRERGWGEGVRSYR